MNHCENFEAQLDEALDLRQLPRERPDLQEHASECADCRRLLDSYVVMLKGISELGCAKPQAGFTRRIVAEVENDRRSRQSRSRAIGSLAAAAALLLAAFWGLRSLGPDQRPANEQEQLARRDPDRLQVAAEPAAGDRSDPGPVQQPRVGGLFEKANEESLVELLLFAGVVTAADFGGSETDGYVGPAANWVTEMAEGLKPLSDSTSGALDDLVDAFPFSEDPDL